MFYKGSFTKDSPVINIDLDGEVTTVAGVNPMLLFDPNWVINAAPAPTIGARPTVEFTSKQKGIFDFEFLHGGYLNSYPFKSFDQPYSILYSK
jgi:hypothetical protein